MTDFPFHYFDNHKRSEYAIFLYHGTGGDEKNLLPLVSEFQNTYRIIGLRGNVQEYRNNRFFQRRSDGTFVQESILDECNKLRMFLKNWSEKEEHSLEKTLHIGFSNGANFLAAFMLLNPQILKIAALLHSLIPLDSVPQSLQTEVNLFVSSSTNDFLIPNEESKKLDQTFSLAGATIETFIGSSGHQITKEEIFALEKFIKRQSAKTLA